MRIALGALALLIGLASGGAAQAGGKILLGPHIGDATIIDLKGVNSDKAQVWFRRELDDEIETCARERGEDSDSREIARCAREGFRQEGVKVYTRRAYCSRLTIYTEFGNFSMVNHEREHEREKESVFDGKPYRPIRTDWKNHRTGEIVGNCNACNTPQMLNTLRVLCPVFYDQLFKGFDPY